MKKVIFFAAVILTGLYIGCENPFDDEDLKGSDADFTYEVSQIDPNIIVFTANNDNLTLDWDFGDGNVGQGPVVENKYLFKGTYSVTLEASNSAGKSVASTQEITIENDAEVVTSDSLSYYLTGAFMSGSKTWAIDSISDNHFGVGPNPNGSMGNFPEWWAAPSCDKMGTGLYDDRFTFFTDNARFDMITNGLVYINVEQVTNFPGAYENKFDYTAPFFDVTNETWQIIEENGNKFIEVSGSSFIGYYTGVRKYQILEISENKLSLRYLDEKNNGQAWYLTLVPENTITGTCQGGGNQGNGVFPIDFESTNFDVFYFGGSTADRVQNPYKSGINTSSYVLKTIHGNEIWAGIGIHFQETIDFSTEKTISLKLFAAKPGEIRITLKSSNPSDTLELDRYLNYYKTNEWQTLSFTFSEAWPNYFNEIVINPGWLDPNSGTFFIDDIDLN